MRTTRCGRIVWSAAISIVVLCASGPIGVVPTTFGEDKPSATADVKITKFHLVETKDGKTLWEVWGDRGEVFDKESVAKVMRVSNPVTVMLYSDQGKLTVRSDSATVNMKTKDIRMERNVTAISEQGNSLQTQSLNWSAKDRRLYTRLPVTVVKGGLTSSGVGMEAETDLERVRFLSRVRSHVMSEGAGPENKGRPSPRNGGTR